jgi:hypothetical protein
MRCCFLVLYLRFLFLLGLITGEFYLQILQEYVGPDLQLYLGNFENLYFIQGGAPAHFTNIVSPHPFE